jgi:deazaflavin-dependent oxidoreductase (nitroreductase family)
MRLFFIKLFMSINRLTIRLSRGRLGSRLGSQTIMLLHTVGRKSGRHIVTPIAYFFLDGFYFLVASNWGKPRQPDWYYNLLTHRQTTIEVRGKTIPVEACPAEDEQYDRLWEYAVEHHPPYQQYKEMSPLHIPIVVLRPITE